MKVNCAFCNAEHEYDDCLDYVGRAASNTVTLLGRLIQLEVFFCTNCDATLLITTSEPAGSNVLIPATDEGE